jgi:hypothetical protein
MTYRTIFIAIIVCLSLGHPGRAISSSYYIKDHLVIDLVNKVEWLRCSVGQQWNGETCYGDAMLLDHKTIDQAINLANEQLGPSWRLPTLDELFSLVCKNCELGKKFNAKVFPNTDPRAYWTGQRNFMSKGSYWTVNFFTGHKFGRFYPEQEMAVRLVRDR